MLKNINKSLYIILFGDYFFVIKTEINIDLIVFN